LIKTGVMDEVRITKTPSAMQSSIKEKAFLLVIDVFFLIF
jgi:hypothetical protein